MRVSVYQALNLPETHPHFTKYSKNKSFHEAGYDSCLTAFVMILLSAKLEAAGSYTGAEKSDSEDSYATAPECDSASINQATLSPPPTSTAFVGLSENAPAHVLMTPPISATKAKKNRRKARKAAVAPSAEELVVEDEDIEAPVAR